MNFKDLIMPFTFALVSTLALQYFFFPNKRSGEVESTFVAPKERKEYKPLNTEVDFFDVERPRHPNMTDVETSWGVLSFSTDGASLESLDIKRELGGEITTVRTIFPVSETEREDRCFLIGLQEKTPFYYSLDSFDDNERNYSLVYHADNDECSVRKTFIIDKESSKIDLLLDIIPKSETGTSIVPRIFYPAPLMPDIRESDVISSIVIDQTDVFTKKRVDQLQVSRGWFEPEVFGSDSRYFIHSLINDPSHFSQRAYYKLENRDRLFSILEGPEVSIQTSWQVSFYFGPKDLTSITQVDSRLEKTLDYSGWFSLIAKAMLYLLKWFYKYLHNYGLAIVAVTLLFQLLLLPLSVRNGEEKFKKQVYAVTKRRRNELKKWFREYKRNIGCQRCQENDRLGKEAVPTSAL